MDKIEPTAETKPDAVTTVFRYGVAGPSGLVYSKKIATMIEELEDPLMVFTLENEELVLVGAATNFRSKKMKEGTGGYVLADIYLNDGMALKVHDFTYSVGLKVKPASDDDSIILVEPSRVEKIQAVFALPDENNSQDVGPDV